jgi:hypothetical protein
MYFCTVRQRQNVFLYRPTQDPYSESLIFNHTMYSPTTLHPTSSQMQRELEDPQTQQRLQEDWQRAIDVCKNELQRRKRDVHAARGAREKKTQNTVLPDRCPHIEQLYAAAEQALQDLLEEAQDAKRDDGLWKYEAPDVSAAYSPMFLSFDAAAKESVDGESKQAHV